MRAIISIFLSTFWPLLAFSANPYDEVGCYTPGECVGNPFLDIGSEIDDPTDCSRECEGFDGCLYFTHYQVLSRG